MAFQKFESDSYCVGRRQRSSTVKVYGVIANKSSTVIFGYCSICSRKKSMTVNDDTIKAGGLGDFFKKMGEKD